MGELFYYSYRSADGRQRPDGLHERRAFAHHVASPSPPPPPPSDADGFGRCDGLHGRFGEREEEAVTSRLLAQPGV